MIALCLGGAECVWCDVEALVEISGLPSVLYDHGKPCRQHERTAHRVPEDWPGPIVAANDIAVRWPRRLDHLVSLHEEKVRRWVKERRKNGHPGEPTIWLTENRRLADRVLPFRHKGSSGMYAPRVAKEVGATGSILCGVPLTPTPHFRESAEHKETQGWPHADGYWEVWQECEEKLRTWNVRSMSGRTRELLGGPDREWLRAHMSQEVEA